MIILIILPNLGGGGAERLYINLAKDWIDKGHIVEFLLMQKKGELLPIVPREIVVTDMKVDRLMYSVIPLIKNINRISPDIVLSSMWPLTSVTTLAWLIARRKGRLFLSDHVMLSIDGVNNLNIPLFFISVLVRGTYHFASGIIAVSNGVKMDICHLGGLSIKKIKVIYNPAALGIKVCDKNNKFVDRQLWGNECDNRILSVGSLKPEKDHMMLIEAFSLIPDSMNAKLIILGDGPLKSDLREFITKKGLNNKITLAGFQHNPYPWYNGADVFVLSSKWEGFGNVIVEALECGTPVVSTNCPCGPAEILNNGAYGKLVSMGNPAKLTKAIIESLEETHNSDVLMDRAKKFSLEEISKQYLKYFSDVSINPDIG